MTKARILITGATGKTGFYAAKALLEEGYPVSVMARKESDKTFELEAMGAELVIADLLDLRTLEPALEGIERAYFVYPAADRLLEATANFFVAAQDAGVKAIVNMSQLPVRKGSTSSLTHQHWLAEKMLDNTDMLVTHICPGFFAEMLYLMNGANILQKGQMYLAHGDAKHAPIAAEDIGRCAAAILQAPEGHDGQRYVLTGPERLSQKDIAAIASGVLETPIEYVPISHEQWADGVRSHGILSDFLISHLVEMAKDYQNGVFDELTTHVEELTGQAPLDMRRFIEKNKAMFTPQALEEMAKKVAA